MSDAASLFLRLNLAAGAAVLLVLALRPLARRIFGARSAYALWWLVPAACVAMLLPARVVTVLTAEPQLGSAAPPPSAVLASTATASAVTPFPWAPALWLLGATSTALWLAIGQLRFLRAVGRGCAGPAVVGVLRPRIVVPADFDSRYTSREQQLIVAHEMRHIERQDPRVNALVAVAQCLAWLNPLAHLLAHYLRIDQELACDAAVIAAHPKARRAYAEAMLKTQLASQPLPLGCHWPAAAAGPLAFRIAVLAKPQPGRRRIAAGAAAVLVLGLAFAAAAWTARPARVRTEVVPVPVMDAAPAQAGPAAQPDVSRSAAEAARPRPRVLAPLTPAAPETIVRPLILPIEAPARELQVRTAARRSIVEPGSAVRVVTTLVRPDGHRMVTDLTAYGSQQDYRTGYYERDDDRRSLFTSVEQQGDRLFVTVSLGKRFEPGSTGTILLHPNETGTLRLPDGEAVTVSAFIRGETPEELDPGGRWIRERAERERDAADRQRHDMERRRILADLDPGTFRCGRIGAIC